MKGNEAQRISKEHISMTQTVPESSTIGAFVDSDFRGIVVKYRGGPVFLKNVTFENCIFIIELPQSPSPEGKSLTRELWARIDEPKFSIEASPAQS
jgi:hypothetical protein